ARVAVERLGLLPRRSWITAAGAVARAEEKQRGGKPRRRRAPGSTVPVWGEHGPVPQLRERSVGIEPARKAASSSRSGRRYPRSPSRRPRVVGISILLLAPARVPLRSPARSRWTARRADPPAPSVCSLSARLSGTTGPALRMGMVGCGLFTLRA